MRNSVFSLEKIIDHKDMSHKSEWGEKYVGCFKDTEKRDLQRYFKEAFGSYRKCIAAAA